MSEISAISAMSTVSAILTMCTVSAISQTELELIFVIQSQHPQYQSHGIKILNLTQNSIEEQWSQIMPEVKVPKILLTHHIENAWTIFPVVEMESDPWIPTVNLPNTEHSSSGHCNKTMSILQYFLSLPYSYLVLVDDDTLLSVGLLASTLVCYSLDTSLFLGQRFGYKLEDGGYSFISGGGGMVLSREAVTRILSVPDGCPCPRADWPDDMHLGSCANKAGLRLTHSNRFHQARPEDYPYSVLKHRKPISFHKHWEINPYEVYSSWFHKYDQELQLRRTVSYEL